MSFILLLTWYDHTIYPGRLKVTIHLLFSLCCQLGDRIESEARSGKAEVNVMGWFSRAALDYIGQGGLGHSFDSLDVGNKNVYGNAIKMFTSVFLL